MQIKEEVKVGFYNSKQFSASLGSFHIEDAPSGSTATGSQNGLADAENWKFEHHRPRRSSSLSESMSSKSDRSRDK
jgi:hypothetical protein